MPRSVRVELSDTAPEESFADLLCIGLFDGEDLPAYLEGAPGAEDVKSKLKSLSVVRPEASRRVLVVGLGDRDEFTTERARVAAALGVRQARRFDSTSIAWVCPQPGGAAAGLTAGTILASYSFDRFKSSRDEDEAPTAIESLTLLEAGDAERIVEIARTASEAANRARDLQNLPANVLNPEHFAERAREIAAAHEAVEILSLIHI